MNLADKSKVVVNALTETELRLVLGQIVRECEWARSDVPVNIDGEELQKETRGSVSGGELAHRILNFINESLQV